MPVSSFFRVQDLAGGPGPPAVFSILFFVLNSFLARQETYLRLQIFTLDELVRKNELENRSSSLELQIMRLLSSEKGFYLTLEAHEKEENDTFHELNKIPSLLRRGTSAPSPAPARGCSCALTMSPSGAPSREPGRLRPPLSPTADSSALRPLPRPRSLTSGSPAHSGLSLMIDSHTTQWQEGMALRAAPYLLSTNSVTLPFSSTVKRPF